MFYKPAVCGLVLVAVAAAVGGAKSNGSRTLANSDLRDLRGGAQYGLWCWTDPNCCLVDTQCSHGSSHLYCAQVAEEGAICRQTQEYAFPESCSSTSIGNGECSATPPTVSIVCYKSRKCRCHFESSGTWGNWMCRTPDPAEWNPPGTMNVPEESNCNYEVP